MMTKNGMALAVVALVVSTTGAARADLIDYTYTTTLSLASGPDAAGLNGATVVIDASFDTTDVYVNRLGLPIVVANSGATYTISGSSIGANNGTFALPSQAFIPTSFPGLFDNNSGLTNQFVTLPVGGTLQIVLISNATTHGNAVHVGNTVSILDFATTSRGDQWELGSSTSYAESSTTVDATLVTSAAPEASSLVLCGIAGTIGVVLARFRRHRISV